MIELDGVRLAADADTRAAITVRRTTGSLADVVLWRRAGDEWQVVERAVGRVGPQALEGTHRLASSFGTHRWRPGWKLGYRRIRKDSYWVGDTRSASFNQWRTRRAGGFRVRLSEGQPNASLRLLDHQVAYEYALVIDIRDQSVPGRGFASFLHVDVKRSPADGVGVPREFMRHVLSQLSADDHPLIAVGR